MNDELGLESRDDASDLRDARARSIAGDVSRHGGVWVATTGAGMPVGRFRSEAQAYAALERVTMSAPRSGGDVALVVFATVIAVVVVIGAAIGLWSVVAA